MNIKIVSPLPEYLILATFPFGSRVYGTATNKSDFDYVNIISQSTGALVLQHKGIDRDNLYIDKPSFFSSIYNGSSPVNFEVAHLEDFKNCYFLPDEEILNTMYTYKMAKCYLGYAKRDLDYPDRIFHVNRCLYIADKIMKKELLLLSDIAKITIETDIEVLRQQIKDKREELTKDRR